MERDFLEKYVDELKVVGFAGGLGNVMFRYALYRCVN